ncbi:MAG: hypothetical protein COA84_02850 [Robiginitomaculum sp.]|nr:MAG: hypothetical protein COA84_02850 [Robiginitomaculum sp.]
MRLRNEENGPSYRSSTSEIAEAGYFRIERVYPRYSEIFFDLLDQLAQAPHGIGIPLQLKSVEDKTLLLTGTPRVRHAPATRILYEIIEDKKVVLVWSVGQKK